MSYETGYESIESEEECVMAEDSTYNDTVSVEQEMYELSMLDPGLQYCVWVAGRTTAGVGPFSHIFIPCTNLTLSYFYDQLMATIYYRV